MSPVCTDFVPQNLVRFHEVFTAIWHLFVRFVSEDVSWPSSPVDCRLALHAPLSAIIMRGPLGKQYGRYTWTCSHLRKCIWGGSWRRRCQTCDLLWLTYFDLEDELTMHEMGQSLLLMITSKDVGFQELNSHIRSVVPIHPFSEIRECLRAIGNAFESSAIQVNKKLSFFIWKGLQFLHKDTNDCFNSFKCQPCPPWTVIRSQRVHKENRAPSACRLKKSWTTQNIVT